MDFLQFWLVCEPVMHDSHPVRTMDNSDLSWQEFGFLEHLVLRFTQQKCMCVCYLLPLLELQFHADAEAAQCVLESLPESFLLKNLMKRSHCNPTHKHHRVRQELTRERERQKEIIRKSHLFEKSYTNESQKLSTFRL